MYEQPPPYAVARPPPHAAGPNMMSKRFVVTIVTMGVALFFIGMMLVTATILLERPEYGDFTNGSVYDSEMEKYEDSVRLLTGSGRMVVSLGGLITCFGFFGSAIGNEAWDAKIRVGMISGGIAVIIAVLVMLSLLSSVPVF